MARGQTTRHAANMTVGATRAGAERPVDHAAAVRSVPALAEANLTLVALVGSRAYGLAHADSDHDYRGVYRAPARALLGLEPPLSHLSANEPDVTCYEVGRFASLALAANPNVLEILWADPVIDTHDGEQLRNLRAAFLSERVRKTYLGYAISQMKVALEGKRAAMHERRRAKAIRHLFRLAEQGVQLLRTGELTLRVADPERIRAYGDLDDAHLRVECALMVHRLENTPSVLPEHPDRERVDEVIYRMRLTDVHDALGA